jgi:hypothetical protein
MAESDITHTYEPNGATKFVMVIAKEGVRTVDGREFAAGSIDWREPPLPLMMIRENDPTGRGGHKGSSAIGMISKIWREDDDQGNGTIYGEGYFSSDEAGDTARQLIAEGTISGVSADVGGAVVEELEASDEFGMRRIIRRGSIVAVTALPIPAFDDTKVSVVSEGEEAPLIASASESWAPKAEWFANPNFTEPTPITITPEGRVFGHAALWGTCHVGYKDRCVTPPRSASNYQYFNTGQVLTADGQTVNVGRLTAGTGHASIEFAAQPAVEHYDNTGWQGAYIHAGEDEHGVWFAGSVSPQATPEQIATLRASMVSGDWRRINNSLELVGVLAVNTPGFPVPRARAGLVAGAQVSLIASGLCGCENEELSVTEEAQVEELTETVEEQIEETETPTLTDEDVNRRLRLLDLEMWEVTGQDFARGGKKKAKPCCSDCAEHDQMHDEMATS